MNDSATVWYESNRFWSPITFGGGIVITVVAVVMHNLFWLLFMAWPCFIFGACVASGKSNKKWPITVIAAIVSALLLYGLKVLMYRPLAMQTSSKTEGQTTQSPPNNQEPPRAPLSPPMISVKPRPKSAPRAHGNQESTSQSSVANSSPPQQIISAPNGIAIGGGTVINPTVNNGPPPAKLLWTQSAGGSVKGLENTKIALDVDHTLEVPEFVVTCDRPCSVTLIGSGYGGMVSIDNQVVLASNKVRLIFGSPRPMSPGAIILIYLGSEGVAPKILSIEKGSNL
jgi:hypothetical protein